MALKQSVLNWNPLLLLPLHIIPEACWMVGLYGSIRIQWACIHTVVGVLPTVTREASPCSLQRYSWHPCRCMSQCGPPSPSASPANHIQGLNTCNALEWASAPFAQLYQDIPIFCIVWYIVQDNSMTFNSKIVPLQKQWYCISCSGCQAFCTCAVAHTCMASLHSRVKDFFI